MFPSSRLIRRPLVIVAVLVAAAALGPAVLVQPASAHASVSSTEPAANARITALPPRVVIHVIKKQATRAGDPIRVYGPTGERIDSGDPVVTATGDAISIGLKPGTEESGTYTVWYKITSADTHIIEDKFSFSLLEVASAGVGPGSPVSPGGLARNATPTPRAFMDGRLRVIGPPGGTVLAAGLVFIALCALLVMLRRRHRKVEEPVAPQPGFRVLSSGEHRLGSLTASNGSAAVSHSDWASSGPGRQY